MIVLHKLEIENAIFHQTLQTDLGKISTDIHYIHYKKLEWLFELFTPLSSLWINNAIK